MSVGVIEVSSGPTLSLAQKLVDNIEDGSHAVGEKLRFPHLKPEYGFEVIDITVVELPRDNIDEEEKDIYYNFCYKVLIRLEVDNSIYKIQPTSNCESTLLMENLKKWLKAKDGGEEFNEEEIYLCKGVEVCNLPNSSGKKEVKVGVLFDSYEVIGEAENVLSSPFQDLFLDPIGNAVITEGVCYSNKKVPENLRDCIRKNLDKLASETPVDYHPNSNDVVRDLVHPALFSYVDGVSQFRRGKSKDSFKSTPEETDFWGRKYESSIYQWLPTPFHISKNGKCTIKEYINNLDRGKNRELYGNLEKLFELFLPYFEEVWSYAKAMEFWDEQKEEDADEDEIHFNKSPVSFKDTELQVITKIVEYNLKPGQTYEGVWHVEGMSHENIVMSGIYFIDRDVDLEGGDLRFKRAFQENERAFVLMNVPQERPYIVNEFAYEGLMPLGRFPTEEGYMLVFPNCHIHKIAKLVNSSASRDARRRIVVFFVVNPEKKIISTAEIAPQQNSSVMSLQNAKQHRLNLMAERKYDKENYNARDIELCEH